MTDPAAAVSPWPAWPEGSADSLERQLLALWEKEDLFQQIQEQTALGPSFVFHEGPPTANGRPGIHHVVARTIKDLICRYHVMNGQRVTRIAGWDTHGLPVELEVEKQLGFSGKKDIETFGVAEFNRRCLESVFTYKDEWQNLSSRIGYQLDYDRAYVTCTRDYVESVWWLLQQLHHKDLLYLGHRVSPYCPRCGTVLSSHELALGWEEVADKTVYVSLPLTDGSGRELVVWTTTPWTLPSNVGVAVHPELEYAEFTAPEHPGRVFIMATSRAAIAEELFGSGAVQGRGYRGLDLVGLRYQRPFDFVPLPEGKDHSVVVAGEFVTADDGSGLVHMSPAFGADDYATGQANNLALLRPVAADGTFSGTTWPELEGRSVTAPETNELLIRRLKELGVHLKTEQYLHSYPHCWRCHSKLIYYARESWFIRTSAVKQRMMELNAGIGWHPPEVGSGRFGEWLGNNIDWALSRDRYWGTPLPIWINDRDPSQVEVIGSLAELKEKAGFEATDDLHVHKPYIDEVTWLAADGGTMRRVPEVIDTWFDSGAMPYAQWHYPFENQEEFHRHFPADFISEGVDQTRGWFYSLLAIATTVFDQPAYHNVIVNELVLDAEGRKMSKSRGNVVNPWEMMERHGADATRLYLMISSQVWQPKRFDESQIAESAGGLLNALRNTWQFFALYAGPQQSTEAPALSHRPLADRWILGRLDLTTAAARAALDKYDVTAAMRAVADFVQDDLSKWYVRLNRSRFWAPGQEADPAAVETLREVLLTVARLLAPGAPFATDWLHRSLTGTSVHLAAYPEDQGRLDPELDIAMNAARKLASLGRAARETAGIRVRQPLAAMQVALPPTARNPTFDTLLDLVAKETNVRSVRIVSSDTELVTLKGKANFRVLGKKVGSDMKAAAAWIATLEPDSLSRLEQGETLVGEWTLTAEDVLIERVVNTDWAVASEGAFVVALDPVVTPELADEGFARELVSRVQRLRKESGYDVGSRIELSLVGDPVLIRAAKAHGNYLAGETLARQVLLDEELETPDRVESITVDDHAAVISIRRIGAGQTLSDPRSGDAS